KLDHGLIAIPDLVQERMLFVFLLEWFNFPEVPMQEEVLDLIGALSKHPTGAQMLREVGAVDFLTQLSPNVDPRLRTIVDGIFDQLFHLPELYNVAEIFQNPNVLTDVFKTFIFFLFLYPAVSTSVRCLKFSVFPWLSLNTTDRHILSSNESSLRSDNHNLVRTTCELLRDVIMQDFPAEIFLQRPSTVQSLLSLLGLNVDGDVSYLTFQALACLEQLCRNLRSRLRFYRDPSFCSAKQDPVSQNSSISYPQEVRATQHSGVSSPEEISTRPSVVGRPVQRVRGDGQDGDAASSSGSSSQRGAPPRPAQQSPLPQPHPELPPEMEAEDSLELQLQQWSLARFAVVTVEHALPLIRTGEKSLKVFQRVLELLAEAQGLLGDSIAPEVWDEHSLTATELREKLRACIETLGDVIYYHHGMTSSEQPESSLIHHRMVFTGTAIFTIRLLQTLLPVEKAGDNLPESTVAAIFLVCLDSSFSVAYPLIHESAVAYLEQACFERYSLYRRVSRVSHCMEATCTFLKDAQAEGDKNWHELLELADQGIDAFPYHQHLPVVKECVQICSYLWKFAQASPLLQSESQKIFLKLLSHPLSPVKAETYSCTLSILKECLGVQNVAKPASSICSGVHFLLHSRVLYEISMFGLQDQAREVSAAAKDILLYLLKGRLMMTAASWSRFNEALYPVIPILQSYASTEDALGNCILLISEASAEKGDEVCSLTARLRAALRLLFTKHHVESVNKLYNILTSETVDLVLRRSAAEQLTIVLQASLLIKENQGDVSEAAALMCILLFDEIARMDVWYVFFVGQSVLIVYKMCYLRYNLPFQAPSHHAVSPYCSVLPPYSDLLSLKPAWEALQITWNTAWHSGIDGLLDCCFVTKIKMITDLLAVNLNLKSGLHDCVSKVRDASSHSTVTFAMTRMHLYLLADRLALKSTAQSNKTILQTLSWHNAVERFLMVRPACRQDERLLVDIVSFLNTFFKQNQSELDHQDLKWLLELLLNQSHTLLNLLLSGEAQTHTQIQSQGEEDKLQAHLSHRLQRELTGLFNTLLLRMTHTSDRICEVLSGPFASELSLRLLQCLRLSDAPCFYGLPSLERTLRTMAHVTALPGWSTHTPNMEPNTLCLKYLSGLLEVISSFYVDLGGNSMSFMGKGVTKNAVICLLHLSHEMMKENKNEDWISLWSLGREQSSDGQSAAQLGLAWLIPLWVDRDPEVRCASLAVGAALSSLERGCVALSESCQNISGGLWATVLNILLERQECSMVRREAAFILQNLLVMPMPANAEEAKECAWQSPCVHDEDSGLCLVGLPALQALLYHCQFFESVGQMVKSCYMGRHAFTLSPPPPPANVTQGMVSTRPEHCQLLMDAAVIFYAIGQSDTDSSDSAFTQESHPGGMTEPAAIVTPHLLLAVCGLLDNLLAVLPEFSLSALKQNQILENMARLERLVLSSVYYVQSLCKFLQSAAVHSEDMPFHREIFKPLLNNLISILTLPVADLDAQAQGAMLNTWADVLMLLATLLRRNQAAVGPSVGVALGKHWQRFSGDTHIHTPKCVTKGGDKQMEREGRRKQKIHRQIHVSSPSSAGEIDSCVERMKHIYAELHLESVKTGKILSQQAVATELRLAAVLMALWPWFLLDDLTMTAALELLCVYTANCTVACSALCSSSSGSSGSVQAVLPKTAVTNSLMHGVMKLASQVAPDNSSIHSLAFSLLANLAISRDCKGVLLKSNFLQHFLSLPMPKAGGRSSSPAAEPLFLWLKLLLNVSFGEDGQQMILRLRGALELLVGLAQSKHSSSKPTILLILHNICFCSANKPKVLANESAVDTDMEEKKLLNKVFFFFFSLCTKLFYYITVEPLMSHELF
uniref:Rotatin n=1 Tax=Cyprinus carpio carpio TaxID=630221 RepID=A0A9J7ZU83_CYPCA